MRDTHEVRLETDGNPGGKIIIDGTDYSGCVSEVSLTLRAGEIPTLDMTLGLVPLAAVGPMHVRWMDGTGNAIRYIEFEDGTSFGRKPLNGLAACLPDKITG